MNVQEEKGEEEEEEGGRGRTGGASPLRGEGPVHIGPWSDFGDVTHLWKLSEAKGIPTSLLCKFFWRKCIVSTRNWHPW